MNVWPPRVATGLAKAAEPDPIFAAIERHRVARAVWMACPYGHMPVDDPGYDEAGVEDAILSVREMQALQAVLFMRPTTLAGLQTLLDYLAAQPTLMKESAHHLDKWPAHLAATLRSPTGGAQS